MSITDWDGTPIEVGTRVRMWDYKPGHPEWGQDAKYRGVVIDLGEWDGDVDDEGRSITIPPSVTVKFDTGDSECFGTSEWEHPYVGPDMEPDDGTGKVEELTVCA